MSGGLASPVFLRAFSLADEGSYGDAVLRGVAGAGLFGPARRMAQLRDLAARFTRGLLSNLPYPPMRGRRECRVRASPAVSCAKVCKKAHTSIQVQRRHPTFPAQWLYDLYRALLGEPGFLATVTWRMIPQSLTPASGRQDHTTSSSASRAVRQKRIRGHRIPSRACDDRETPLVPGQDQIAILLIWPRGQVNFGKSEILSGRPIAAWVSIT